MPEEENLDKLVKKFQNLLTKFLENDHQVVDDTCLEKLLSHLSQKGDGYKLLQLQENRVFCERSLQAYEKGLVSESLLSFALRLHGQLISIEAYFSSKDLQDSTSNIIHSPRLALTCNASLQCSFVQMVSALLSHKCGIDWLAASDVWQIVQKVYEKNQSIYVARECQNFLSNFLLHFGTDKIKIQNEILKSPMQSICSSANNGCLNFNSSIDFLINALEVSFKAGNYHIPQLVADQTDKTFDQLMFSTQDNVRLTKIARMQALLAFAITEPVDKHLDVLELKLLKILSQLIDMKNFSVIQSTLLQSQNYWCTLKPRVQHLPREFQLDHQLVYIQVMPLLQMNFSTIKKDCIRNFLEKLSVHTTDATKQQGLKLRELVMQSSDPKKLASRNIHSIIQMKDVMSRCLGIFVFRTLMCLLVQFIEESSEEIIESQDSGFMGTTFESIITLIDHFHFTWRESIETTCLLTYMQELLCESALAHRQMCQVMQIMKRAIAGFMAPNLALLMNTLNDTALENLGPQLYRCLHHTTWEVRDSALEVVLLMAQIAESKFPAFQEHLLIHKLCSLPVSMAVGDEESYVRVSALKCLTQMVAVPYFWEQSLQQERLPELMTTILCQDSEGIVRCEAANLVSAMLYNKQFNKEERERMFIVMAAAAVNDLYWEVKVNALQFWKHSICQLTTAEGMIDGKFPSVTFSGPSRKIVILNTKEIQSRLQRILSELSRTRCLAVLLSALQDPDLQVTRKAAEILSTLQNLLLEHELLTKNTESKVYTNGDIKEESNTTTKSNESSDTSMDSQSEKVIDGIIGQSDLTLLSTVCRNQLSLEETAQATPSPLNVDLVKPEEFLQALSSVNIEEVVATRSAWLLHCSEHLDSLLTDMLEAREFHHNTNDMDCY